VRRRIDPVLCVLLALFVVLGLSLRLPGLELKPLHSDEGVNGWFTLRLYWWNHYRYNPSDYHGPFLYYANLLAFWILGPGDVALRISSVISGTLLPFALLPALRHLGRVGLVVASVLLLVAPGMVYFSRTCIHEIHLVLATTLWVSCLARYAAAPSRRWAWGAALAGALAFANKETALITAGSLGAGLGLAWLAGRPMPGDDRLFDPDLFGGKERNEALSSWRRGVLPHWNVGFAVFALITVLLYTSFFTNIEGIPAFFQAYGPWFGYGVTGRNQGKSWSYFAQVMTWTTTWAVIPYTLAVLWAIARRHRTGLALAGWSLSAFVVYSAVPYKTPWCALEIELPIFLTIGWGARQAWLVAREQGSHPIARALAVLLLPLSLVSVPAMLSQSREVNEGRFDDDRIPYVFVQTQRGFYDLMRDATGFARALPGADGRGPRVMNVDCKNPFRWYTLTRGWDHTRTTYVYEPPKAADLEDKDLVLTTGSNVQGTSQAIGASPGEWHRESYPLRPGHKVTAWFRADAWAEYQSVGGREGSPWPVPPPEDLPAPPRD
jgi:uncharacterized protein (TIGR03663 family)